jgi:hypothetical protein
MQHGYVGELQRLLSQDWAWAWRHGVFVWILIQEQVQMQKIGCEQTTESSFLALQDGGGC